MKGALLSFGFIRTVKNWGLVHAVNPMTTSIHAKTLLNNFHLSKESQGKIYF